MNRDQREAADDSFKSYDLAIAEMRKREIRKGNIQPRPDDPEEIALHQQWQREREKST